MSKMVWIDGSLFQAHIPPALSLRFSNTRLNTVNTHRPVRKAAMLAAAAVLTVAAMGAGQAFVQGRITFFADKNAVGSYDSAA